MQSVQWPMRKKIRQGTVFLAWVGVVLLFIALGIAASFLLYAAAYTQGSDNSYNAGIEAGRHNACVLAGDWARWSAAAESDMVKSKHYTQATGNEVIQNTTAGYAHVCGVILASPNIYDPNSKPVTVPLSKPTLPIGSHAPFKKIP